jgi:hypothetical protein
VKYHRISLLVATFLFILLLKLGPYNPTVLSGLSETLNRVRINRRQLELELECITEIANYENENSKLELEELKILMKSVISYLENNKFSDLQVLQG